MQWADTNGFEGEGSGIRFVENLGAIKLSNLRVTRWDGILEEKPDTAPRGREDVVWLQNGQSIFRLHLQFQRAKCECARARRQQGDSFFDRARN